MKTIKFFLGFSRIKQEIKGGKGAETRLRKAAPPYRGGLWWHARSGAKPSELGYLRGALARSIGRSLEKGLGEGPRERIEKGLEKGLMIRIEKRGRKH
jgi:hypothetical protein